MNKKTKIGLSVITIAFLIVATVNSFASKEVEAPPIAIIATEEMPVVEPTPTPKPKPTQAPTATPTVVVTVEPIATKELVIDPWLPSNGDKIYDECYDEVTVEKVYSWKYIVDKFVRSEMEIRRNPLGTSDPAIPILAVIGKESKGKPGLSSTDGHGSVGLMQIIPHVWTADRETLKQPNVNIGTGMNMLDQIIAHYYDEPMDADLKEFLMFFYDVPEEMDNEVFWALSAYNCGYTSLEAGKCLLGGGTDYARDIFQCWIPVLEQFSYNLDPDAYNHTPVIQPRDELFLRYKNLRPVEDKSVKIAIAQDKMVSFNADKKNDRGFPLMEPDDMDIRRVWERGARIQVIGVRVKGDGGRYFYELATWPGHYIQIGKVVLSE